MREVAVRVGLLPISLEYIGEQLCGSIQTFKDFLTSLKHLNGLKAVINARPLNSKHSLMGMRREDTGWLRTTNYRISAFGTGTIRAIA